jgi:hypothetical protein
MNPFPFFDLPPEIREKIYLFLCQSPAEYIPLHSDRPRALPHLLGSPPPEIELDMRAIGEIGGGPAPDSHHAYFPWKLLFVNSQMYHEVRPLYFSHNAFTTFVTHKNSRIDYFTAPAFRDNRCLIKKLRIIILKFGKGDYFLESLAPVLEDMILNGSLRDLEVRVAWTNVFDGCHGVVGGSARVRPFIQGEAMVELKRILRDPYLERVRFMTFLRTGWDSGWDGLEDHTDLLGREKDWGQSVSWT